MPNKKARPLTEDEWIKLIEAFHASGLTQKAFSQQHGIAYDRFRHHYQRSSLFRGRRRQPVSTDFKPLSVISQSGRVADWCVHFGDQVRINCPAQVSVETIIHLIRGLTHDA